MPTSFGEKIRQLREERGLTQAQLADTMGVRVMTLSNIERGGNTTTDTLVAVAKALKVPLAALFRGGAPAARYTERQAEVVAERLLVYMRQHGLQELLTQAVFEVNRELAEGWKDIE